MLGTNDQRSARREITEYVCSPAPALSECALRSPGGASLTGRRESRLRRSVINTEPRPSQVANAGNQTDGHSEDGDNHEPPRARGIRQGESQ
jgi:hypothetical protein